MNNLCNSQTWVTLTQNFGTFSHFFIDYTTPLRRLPLPPSYVINATK